MDVVRSTPEMSAPPEREWTQTRTELTISVKLPAGVVARDLVCSITTKQVDIRVRSTGEQLVAGQLHGESIGSVWSVDGGTLHLEIEKATAKFWPCALCGDRHVDIQELIAKEKRDAEPAYKLPPGPPF